MASTQNCGAYRIREQQNLSPSHTHNLFKPSHLTYTENENKGRLEQHFRSFDPAEYASIGN